MSKILLLSSGLINAQKTMQPFLERLEVYLEPQADCVDVRNTETFDERTFFEYDQVIFIFSCALNSIPSTTLEIFKKLESQEKNHTEIYALIACDEYEAENCNLSEKIMKQWCKSQQLVFKGSLKIGSSLFIMHGASGLVVSNYIKNFAHAIIEHQDVCLKVSMLTDKVFMKKANSYWHKEIKKKQKEKEISK